MGSAVLPEFHAGDRVRLYTVSDLVCKVRSLIAGGHTPARRRRINFDADCYSKALFSTDVFC